MAATIPGSSSSINLEAAAHEAALADGIISSSLSRNSQVNDTISKTKKAGLRRGKWTAEEEAYANRLILEFKMGLLPLTDGTTLRTFLSKLLNCDPMRISKKFVGGNCIGKQVFRRREVELEMLTNDQIENNRKELSDLERQFLERVAQNNRSKSTAKEGKMGAYGDDEGGTLAPWMMPPEDQPNYSNRDSRDGRDNSRNGSSQPSSSSSHYQGDRGGYKNRLPRFQNENAMGAGYDGAGSSVQGSGNSGGTYGYVQKYRYQDHDYHNSYPNNHGYGPSVTGSNEICDKHVLSSNQGYHNTDMHGGSGSGGGGGYQQGNMDREHPTYLGGNNNGAVSGASVYGDSTMGRVNSLEVLCSLDMIKFPSPASMDGLNVYSTLGEDPFSYKRNPGADSGPQDPYEDMGYRNSSQSEDLGGGGSLWPSMFNLVNAAEAASNSEATDDERSRGVVQGEGSGHSIDTDRQNQSVLKSLLSSGGDEVVLKEERLPSSKGALNPNPLSAVDVDLHLTGATEGAALQVSEMQRNVRASNTINVENKVRDGDGGPGPVAAEGLRVVKDEVINNAYPFAKNGNSNPPVSTDENKRYVQSNELSRVPQPPHMVQYQLQQQEQALIAQKYHLQVPRNSSVENFWMLVDIGDLPQPDNNVLSETLWNSEHTGPDPPATGQDLPATGQDPSASTGQNPPAREHTGPDPPARMVASIANLSANNPDIQTKLEGTAGQIESRSPENQTVGSKELSEAIPDSNKERGVNGGEESTEFKNEINSTTGKSIEPFKPLPQPQPLIPFKNPHSEILPSASKIDILLQGKIDDSKNILDRVDMVGGKRKQFDSIDYIQSNDILNNIDVGSKIEPRPHSISNLHSHNDFQGTKISKPSPR
mmetsp:Transcript_15200/g.14597  ORF Transcript_15200/g.14597 Transcript_15200/m.14597 type:complete len:875 (+) Transcript_15200:164-2788(+)